LTSASGCYTLSLPPDTWIDVRVADRALEQAETALAAGDLEDARAQAATAATLSRPTFLPGEDGSWVEEQRRGLRDVLLRALECQRDASLAAGEFGEAVRSATEITELEPFRESSYRALMQAHIAAGNPAEALRVYERCRRFLGEELGAYPSAETEALYRELLSSTPKSALVDSPPIDADHVEVDEVPESGSSPRRRRRRFAAAGAGALLIVVAAAAIATTQGAAARPKILPTSLVELDPNTLEPTKVIGIGPRADLVVATHRYVWFTRGILRYAENDRVWNNGDRALTRVDPATGDKKTFGEVAPCGLTPDPSGDVWVLNCYPSGHHSTVQRINHRTKDLGSRYPVPGGGFIRGMTYGGDFLWLNGGDGARRVIKLDPQTGHTQPINTPYPAGDLAYDGNYGELWIVNYVHPGVSRMDVSSVAAGKGRVIPYPHHVGVFPAWLLVQGDSVWIADWSKAQVVRVPARGAGKPTYIHLPVRTGQSGGVTALAAGGGYIWATVPDDKAVWRINEETGEKKRFTFRYHPWGIDVADDGRIWVTFRARDPTLHS
jgi:hypothetical protein